MVGRRRNLFILLFVVGLTIASVVVIFSQPTKLGLDLRGGTSLVYQGQPTPQQPEVDSEAIDRAIEIIRQRVDTLGVSEPEIVQVGEDQIDVSLPDVQDIERAVNVIGTTAQLHYYDWEPNVIPEDPNDPNATEQGFNRLFDAVRFASTQKPECFEDACTTNGPRYYLFDRDTLELLAGPEQKRTDLFLDFPRERQPKNTVIQEVPQGTIVVTEPPTDDPETDEDESEGPAEYFVVRDRPSLSGTDIENPEQNSDPTTNQPNVTFDFTDDGQTAFQDVTRTIAQRGAAEAPPGICGTNPAAAANLSDHFAIVLDNEVVSRPIIDFCENPDGIDGRTGAQISGGFTLQEAQDLAELLRIGALPIDLNLISQSTVSATLGQQALDQGLVAGIVGLIVVVLFLLAYYRFLGLVAALGLGVYALFFLALIKLIPITLTLPGIAGLILTIGVAADSNIVIFERIKEEARAGRSMPSAISAGYRKGIATIIDANVITLITAFILFILATAGVKGFAFTLGVGTIVSLFTAVVFTQAVLGTLGRSELMRSPRLLGAGEQRVRWHFDFTGASRWFFSISGVILAIGAISFATLQLNLGIDFESGTRIKAALGEPAEVEDVRSTIDDAGVSGAGNAAIQEVDDPEFGDNVVQIEGEFETEEGGTVQSALEDQYGLEGGDQGFQNTTIGASFGEQVAENAVRAIVLSLLVIAIYVAIRFQPKYAVPVLIALVHDILITAGVYSLSEREVTSATVAAFLTILGYSMYDTVIVFDRIRENEPRLPRAAFSQIVNRSMSEVLTRSLITGLSTVFLITVLLIFGGETLKDFAFAMMVGVASGTYSSIFIAAPVLTAWKEREPGYRGRRMRLEEAMGYVPAFPEENVVAKLEEVEEAEEPEEAPVAAGREAPAAPAAPPAEPPAAAPEPELAPQEPERPREPGPPVGAPGGDGQAEPPGDGAPQKPAEPLIGAGTGGEREERQPQSKRPRRRQSRRKRKHGRHR
jgi:SecD/SecF fusion protein